MTTTTDRRALAIETDTKLADLAAEQAKIEVSLGHQMDALHRAVGDEKKHRFSGPWKMTDAEVLNFDSSTLTETPWKIREFEDAHAKHYDLLVRREQNDIEMDDLNEVWAEAGYWHRYFLVDNTNGHVHREMSCSTCYPTTQYRWLVGLADCDEAAMVAEYGEMACTVCFPEAPAMKGYGDGTSGLARYSAEEKAQRAAEKAAKQAAKDAKAITQPDGQPLRERDWRTKEAGKGSVIKTERAASIALTDCLQNIIVFGYSIEDHEPQANYLAEALAHKQGKTIETVLAEHEAKARKRK